MGYEGIVIWRFSPLSRGSVETRNLVDQAVLKEKKLLRTDVTSVSVGYYCSSSRMMHLNFTKR